MSPSSRAFLGGGDAAATVNRAFCAASVCTVPLGGSQSYDVVRLALANPLRGVASMLASVAAKSSPMAALPGSC